MMLRQNNANESAIQDMRNALDHDGTPYYWVNVGLVKYFTQDLTEASAYYNAVGDSLYRATGNGFGDKVLETIDAPESYCVELELFPVNGADDADLPENWVSSQVSQLDAERIAANCTTYLGLSGAYAYDPLMDNVGKVVARIVRSGAGTVESVEVNWQDLRELNRAASIDINEVSDQQNNVGRMCTVLGRNEGRRVWKVEMAMWNARNSCRAYFLRNVETGAGKIFGIESMTNLY